MSDHDYDPRKTQAYSFIRPDKIIDVGDKKMEDLSDAKPLTVKDIISKLIEIEPLGWRALPQSVKNGLIERPHDFKLAGKPTRISITYNGVTFSYVGNASWVIDSII